MTLSSGALTYFDYSATNGTNGAPADFDSFNLSFIADAALTGDWNPEVQISAVPVPAAIWLFGSGLLGLVGVTIRRRKNTE